MSERQIVYVIGAGLSAGLGFPVVGNLLRRIWTRLETAGLADDVARVIRFHHPAFNPGLDDTFPDIETLLSEMQANAQLFDSSRPATGNFTSTELEARRQALLLEIAGWFHELQAVAAIDAPSWLGKLADLMLREKAQVISFNWDLVLDELLFGDNLSRSSYGFTSRRTGPRLIKPHGSLNWFERSTGKYLAKDKRFPLVGTGPKGVVAFKPFRAPRSSKRIYMPLIVPPVFNKEFDSLPFQELWQETVSVVSTATEVRFLGYSLPAADFHARFILRCGFHNQENGKLCEDGSRASATGRARVSIVNPDPSAAARIRDAVGWDCDYQDRTIEDWVSSRT